MSYFDSGCEVYIYVHLFFFLITRQALVRNQNIMPNAIKHIKENKMVFYKK